MGADLTWVVSNGENPTRAVRPSDVNRGMVALLNPAPSHGLAHMKAPSRPPDERRRLETLRQYDVLDTLPEQALDDLAALAAYICDAPISTITLIDAERQWFKAKVPFHHRVAAG